MAGTGGQSQRAIARLFPGGKPSLFVPGGDVADGVQRLVGVTASRGNIVQDTLGLEIVGAIGEERPAATVRRPGPHRVGKPDEHGKMSTIHMTRRMGTPGSRGTAHLNALGAPAPPSGHAHSRASQQAAAESRRANHSPYAQTRHRRGQANPSRADSRGRIA